MEKTLILETKLTGQARSFYSGLRDEERRKYGILKTRLAQRFGVLRKSQTFGWREIGLRIDIDKGEVYSITCG